jgi:hypothetical protein
MQMDESKEQEIKTAVPMLDIWQSGGNITVAINRHPEKALNDKSVT